MGWRHAGLEGGLANRKEHGMVAWMSHRGCCNHQEYENGKVELKQIWLRPRQKKIPSSNRQFLGVLTASYVPGRVYVSSSSLCLSQFPILQLQGPSSASVPRGACPRQFGASPETENLIVFQARCQVPSPYFGSYHQKVYIVYIQIMFWVIWANSATTIQYLLYRRYFNTLSLQPVFEQHAAYQIVTIISYVSREAIVCILC